MKLCTVLVAAGFTPWKRHLAIPDYSNLLLDNLDNLGIRPFKGANTKKAKHFNCTLSAETKAFRGDF